MLREAKRDSKEMKTTLKEILEIKEKDSTMKKILNRQKKASVKCRGQSHWKFDKLYPDYLFSNEEITIREYQKFLEN